MIGQTLGHYRITEKIGAGGMGEVYKARDEHLDRDVAIKVLPAGTLGDETARKRFKKEALTLSKLNHPNIATIHDFDTQDGVDFLVMEFVPGETLSERLKRGPLPEKEISKLGAQIADALDTAHEKGVIHRDLKPGNIAFTEKGAAKVLDFGIAKLLQSKEDIAEAATVDTLTKTMGVAGTLPYMAPEQLRGEEVDGRSDIHALGAVLYEMATGRRAFPEAQTAQLTHDILGKAPVPPRTLNARASAELERIILKCLEKDPENRYQSAKEMVVDLRQLGTATQTAAGLPPLTHMAEPLQRKLAAIMFTDMVGYSALTQENEALALELLQEMRRRLRPVFPKHEGKEIKTIGDAFLVEFASAVRAVRCAIEMQTVLAEYNSAAPPERRIQIRIGLHVGDVVYQENDVFGDAVNIASRIEPLATPGGICVSEDVARQIRNQIELPVLKLGKGELKNIQVPVDIYRIVLPGERRRLAFSERLAFRLRQHRTLVAVVAGMAIALSVGLGWWTFRGTIPIFTPGSITSIAVLPLDNLMGDAEQDYFVAGMHEALITELSKISALKVISRTSTMQYKGTQKLLPEIAQELGVDAVVEGSVFLDGNHVRITAQLIHASTDAHLWADNFDREMRDILALHSEVARAIAREIKIAVTPKEETRLAATRPVNPEAYQRYLQGRSLVNIGSRATIEEGIKYFEEGIAIDPNDALSYAGLAEAYRSLSSFHLPPLEVMPRAKAAALKALELDPTFAEARTTLAYIKANFDWDILGAEEELKRAIEINPNSADAHGFYGVVLTSMSRYDEATAEMNRALEIDPLSLWAHAYAILGNYMARDYDKAIESCEVVLRQVPTFPWAYAFQGLSYVETGRFPEAIAAAEAATQSTDSLFMQAIQAQVYAATGKTSEARELLVELEKRARRQYVCPYEIGLAYVALGDKDEAFNWLERAYLARADCMIWLRVDVRLDPIRDDSRFQDLLARMNFPD